MKNYKVPVYYNVVEYVVVAAESEEAALKYIQENEGKIPTHCSSEQSYIDESFEVEADPGCVFETNEAAEYEA